MRNAARPIRPWDRARWRLGVKLGNNNPAQQNKALGWAALTLQGDINSRGTIPISSPSRNKEPTLSCEEFIALRAALGLSQQQVADIAGHSSARTVQHWEKGRSLPQADVCRALLKLDDEMEEACFAALNLALKNSKKSGFKGVTLTTYSSQSYLDTHMHQDGLPYTAHRALVRRCHSILEQAGIDTEFYHIP